MRSSLLCHAADHIKRVDAEIDKTYLGMSRHQRFKLSKLYLEYLVDVIKRKKKSNMYYCIKENTPHKKQYFGY